jgi:hypothetical protein
MEMKINWRDFFQGKLADGGYGKADVQTIYRLEMDARAFFDFGDIMPEWMQLQNIERDGKELRFKWVSRSSTGKCPTCGRESASATGLLDFKTVQDIPRDGMAVYHDAAVNKFGCDNPECVVKIFAERIPTLVGENGRKTHRFINYSIARASASGCKRAQDDIRREGGVVSNDSIGRYIKAKSAEIIKDNLESDNVRVLSVDDFNLVKGNGSTGCTVFVDGETHRVLVVVKGTTKEVAKGVIEKFRSAEILSRDRATSYASAGKEMGLTQVADRFHLVDNAQKAVEEALAAELPARIYIRSGDGWISADPSGDSAPGDVKFSVSEDDTEERIRLAGLTPAKAKKYRDTLRMLELDSAGLRTAQIAESMGTPQEYVRVLRRGAVDILQFVSDRISARAETVKNLPPPEVETPGKRAGKTVGGKRVKPAGESIVEPYRETVITMWKAGGNHRTIHPTLVDMGFEGSANAIYQYILKLKKESPNMLERKKRATHPDWVGDFDLDKAESFPEVGLESVQRDDVYAEVLKQARETRPEEKHSDKTSSEEQEAKPKKPKSSRPASAKTSPLPSYILDLMFGPEDVVADEEPEKEKKTKSAL